MKRLAMMMCGLWAAFVVSVGDASAEKRVALVIGNGAYQNAAKLANPANDANAMAELFRRAGFEVVEARLDLGNLEFKRVAREFTAVAREADIAVLYYAGHGIEVNGTNYLIPVDAKLATDFDVEDEALSLDRLMRALEPAKRLRLVILDACRENPFVRTMQRAFASRAVVTGLAKVEPTTSDTLIAYATKPGSTADDGNGENSPFATALLKNLTVPGRDVRIALGYVRDEVIRATGNRQEPFVAGSLGGATVALIADKEKESTREISVLPSPQAPVAPGIDPRRDYEFAERVGTREAWDSFLAIHRAGFYADLARAQRDKLVSGIQSAPQKSASLPSIDAAQQPAKPLTPPPAASPNVALLSPPAATKPSDLEPRPDQRTLTRDLQTELKRVGCDPGTVDGNWSPRSRQALEQFNRRAGMGLDVQVATTNALDAVKGQRGRICPLTCGDGQRVDGDRCIAIPVEPKRQLKKEAARPPARKAEPPRKAARQAPPPRREPAVVEREAPARASGPPISIGVGGIGVPIGIGIGGISIGR